MPYVIRNLPQWPADQQEVGGACVEVKLPAEEPITVAKVSMHDRKLALFTGETVSGEQLFTGWNDILCRTKLAIDTCEFTSQVQRDAKRKDTAKGLQ